MKLLVLGGTVFLGRHVVESALARGHSVTLFNRGRHNPNLFPKLEKLRGDRDGDLSALGGRRFDRQKAVELEIPANEVHQPVELELLPGQVFLVEPPQQAWLQLFQTALILISFTRRRCAPGE